MRPKLNAIKTNTISVSHVNGVTRTGVGGGYFPRDRGVAIADLAVVVSVTVAVALSDLSSTTDHGETAHVAACGAAMPSDVTACRDPFNRAADAGNLARSLEVLDAV